MNFLDLYQHLLPKGRAWSIIVDKPLRRFFKGLTGVWSDIEAYFGAIYLDLFVGSTRALDEWDDQFGFTQELNDPQSRLDRLSSAWQASGGQSPAYIQNTLQAAGFDVYVHEWWQPETLPGTAIEYDGVNYMPSPFDPSGWTGVTDPDNSYVTLVKENPSGEDFVGEFEKVGPGAMSLTFGNYEDAAGGAGTKHAASILVKPKPIKDVVIYYQYDDGGTNVSEETVSIDVYTGVVTNITGGGSLQELKLTELSDGYIILQVLYVAQTNNRYRGVFYANNAGTGDKIEVQAAYFGKSSGYPANIISPLPNPDYTAPPALTPRNPLQYLADDARDVVYFVECGEPLAQCGEELAQAGETVTPAGYPLVNKVTNVLVAGVEAGEELAQCGEPLAQCGEIFGYQFEPRRYDVPTDPDTWPYFLYFAGEKFPNPATVDSTRRKEFERLVLKICPLHLWAGMLITYD